MKGLQALPSESSVPCLPPLLCLPHLGLTHSSGGRYGGPEEQGAVHCSHASEQEERGNGGRMAYLGSDVIVLIEAMSPLTPPLVVSKGQVSLSLVLFAIQEEPENELKRGVSVLD